MLISSPIRFDFNIDKFIACLTFFADKKLGDLSKLKVCKLLYFADKYHLVRYGRPIVGDVYYRLDNGPVPSMVLNIMDEVLTGDRIYFGTSDVSNKTKFDEFIGFKKPFHSRYPIFFSKKKHDFDCLSESEMEALVDVMGKYGRKSPSALINLTHEERAWLESSPNSEMDYRLFFDNDSKVNLQAKEYMEAMQESWELALGLR